MHVSIVIRTLNEARHLGELLESIEAQDKGNFTSEVVLVDSGSTDGTLEIAEKHGCIITHISREEFSFGRSLNRGCSVANGEILVLISGHCIPTGNAWLRLLCTPVAERRVDYAYGRQIGGAESHFSECRIFNKYFPPVSRIPQDGFFCNNANSALWRASWQREPFNEHVTGLEDMELAQRLVRHGGRIGYVAEACVYHHHAESWKQVERRFEREALALQGIMPQIHIRRRDLLRYMTSSIWLDYRQALREHVFMRKAKSIALYRFWQYIGSFKGNREHRKLSQAQKDKYFYPGLPPAGPAREQDAEADHLHADYAARHGDHA
jgi:glycosyltransferase involved in cell wall biosynthesis